MLRSSQWYGSASAAASAVDEGRKGDDSGTVVLGGRGGNLGGGEKASGESMVSKLSIAARECGESQGGGMMFARRWRLRRRASQSGTEALCGGLSGFRGP